MVHSVEELHEAFCAPKSAQAGQQAAANSLGAEALSLDGSQAAGQAQQDEGVSVPAKPQQQQQQHMCPQGLGLAAAEGATASAGTQLEPGNMRSSSTADTAALVAPHGNRADTAALDAPPGFRHLSLTASARVDAPGRASAVHALAGKQAAQHATCSTAEPGRSAGAAAMHSEEPVVATASTTAAAGHGSELEEDPLAALMELDAELERKKRRQQRRAMQVG